MRICTYATEHISLQILKVSGYPKSNVTSYLAYIKECISFRPDPLWISVIKTIKIHSQQLFIADNVNERVSYLMTIFSRAPWK